MCSARNEPLLYLMYFQIQKQETPCRKHQPQIYRYFVFSYCLLQEFRITFTINSRTRNTNRWREPVSAKMKRVMRKLSLLNEPCTRKQGMMRDEPVDIALLWGNLQTSSWMQYLSWYVLGGQQVIFTVAVLGSSSYSMKRVKVLQGTFTWGRDLRHNTTAKFKIWKDVERSQSVLACLSRRLFWGTLSVCWFIRRLQIELNKHLHEKNHAWTTDYSNHSIAENELTSWNHVTGAPSKRIVYCLIWTHGSLQI